MKSKIKNTQTTSKAADLNLYNRKNIFRIYTMKI